MEAGAADAAVARLLAPATEDVRLANAITIARVAWAPRLYDPHLQKWLHRIKVPTLVVWGEHDRVLPPAIAAEWGRRIPGAKVEIVPGCGHWVAHERPDALIAAITRFLAEPKAAP
jgi:pimeloyl-ACP methyl ester carboxylesterase